MKSPLGLSGRIAAYFLHHRITPLLALVAALLGLFAVMVTPREEEPQINVTMANVLVPFPGAAAKEVEAMIATPAEQVFSRMTGVEHVMSVSRPGLAILTVQFKVGVSHNDALVKLYDTVHSHRDWLPANLGVLEPIVKPKGIDDVPIVSLTLWTRDPQLSNFDLERVAHSLEADLKRVKGTGDVYTIGGPGRAVNVELDAAKLAAHGLTIPDLRQALQGANVSLTAGDLIASNRSTLVETGAYLADAHAVADVIVGTHAGKPVALADVAVVTDDALPPARFVWLGMGQHANSKAGGEFPAVTLAITKQPGQNAVDVANGILQRVDALRNTVIPAEVEVKVTRNYGDTANDKAIKLIEKLIFATASVVALVFFALGRREAAIVGLAVVLTLTVTLFASWAWGFTLNRVSLFALIFSIGILVDDAIVVVENIHRHQKHYPERTLSELIPHAVDEVGGPTILATLTVIAALLPMAFVSGLMGPYMSPIPINASMGMMLSLTIAFVVTPWLARLWMKSGTHSDMLANRLAPLFGKIFQPFLDAQRGSYHRRMLAIAVTGLIALSVLLPVLGWVQLKMLPFDNKSELQVIVDMPAGTPVEHTAATLRALGAYLTQVPEVTDYQAYAGTSAPINFNGLVRQYYLRSGGEVGDLQVNLVDKHHRDEQSHAIATRLRPQLAAIGKTFGANVKVVEVPPGPPVMAPIVAEVYGPSDDGRRKLAQGIRHVLEHTEGVVDVDDSSITDAPRKLLVVDRRKAALLGIPQAVIATTLHAALSGETVTWLRDASKYPVGVDLHLPVADSSNLDTLLSLAVHNTQGGIVPMRELVTVTDTLREQPVFHKDGLPVNYVVADMAGRIDSPLYGMFSARGKIAQLPVPGGGKLGEYFIHQPEEAYAGFALKWDGEWQITYETFRDMGTAYAVGLVLIYLLVVAQFGSYLTPLIIMAPIPLTVIGVMPGHALLHSQFTATSMIGMIALAGIIVRNSILLVDFINLQITQGVRFEDAVVHSAVTRAQPIALTGIAAMLGALFILDDPIFNGLAIALIFGIFVSTLLTLVVIPLLYYVAYRNRLHTLKGATS